MGHGLGRVGQEFAHAKKRPARARLHRSLRGAGRGGRLSHRQVPVETKDKHLALIGGKPCERSEDLVAPHHLLGMVSGEPLKTHAGRLLQRPLGHAASGATVPIPNEVHQHTPRIRRWRRLRRAPATCGAEKRQLQEILGNPTLARQQISAPEQLRGLLSDETFKPRLLPEIATHAKTRLQIHDHLNVSTGILVPPSVAPRHTPSRRRALA